MSKAFFKDSRLSLRYEQYVNYKLWEASVLLDLRNFAIVLTTIATVVLLQAKGIFQAISIDINFGEILLAPNQCTLNYIQNKYKKLELELRSCNTCN